MLCSPPPAGLYRGRLQLDRLAATRPVLQRSNGDDPRRRSRCVRKTLLILIRTAHCILIRTGARRGRRSAPRPGRFDRRVERRTLVRLDPPAVHPHPARPPTNGAALSPSLTQGFRIIPTEHCGRRPDLPSSSTQTHPPPHASTVRQV